MRILFVVHKYPPFSLGGTEIYTHNLVTELHRRGHQVTLYFRADFSPAPFAARDEQVAGLPARRLSAPLTGWRAFPLVEFFRTFRNPAIERDFAAFVQRVRPDIVHFQHLMALSAHLLPIARQAGLPTVLTLHDYWFLCANAQLVWPSGRRCPGKAAGLNCARCALARFRSPLTWPLRPALAPLFWYRDAVVRAAGLSAHHYFSPSEFLAARYRAAGFPADRLTILENGLPLTALRSLAWQPAPNGRLRCTFLGSLAWQKGVHVLVNAFRDLPPERAQLRIYGPPNTFPAYSATLRQMANPANTIFMGAIPNDEVGAVLATTDVLIVPSLWYENSPLVIQEAHALEIPVIASDLGALPEKVGAGGWLFPPGDAAALRARLQTLLDSGIPAATRAATPPPTSIQETADRLLAHYTALQ